MVGFWSRSCGSCCGWCGSRRARYIQSALSNASTKSFDFCNPLCACHRVRTCGLQTARVVIVARLIDHSVQFVPTTRRLRWSVARGQCDFLALDCANGGLPSISRVLDLEKVAATTLNDCRVAVWVRCCGGGHWPLRAITSAPTRRAKAGATVILVMVIGCSMATAVIVIIARLRANFSAIRMRRTRNVSIEHHHGVLVVWAIERIATDWLALFVLLPEVRQANSSGSI
jgi:hypothetical protein